MQDPSNDLRNRLEALRSGTSRLIGEITAVHPAADEWLVGEICITGRGVRWAAEGLPGLEVGRVVQIQGTHGRHPEHGECYLIQNVLRSELPRERQAIIRYLAANVRELGPKRAEQLVDVLGAQDCLRRLKEQPDLVHKVWAGRRGNAVASGIREWLRRQRDEAWMTTVVPRLMAAAGMGFGLARRICSFFTGSDVVDVILRSDTYRLLDAPGIGWKTADVIAKGIGVAHDDPGRADWATLWTLREQQRNGHTAAVRTAAVDLSARLASLPVESIQAAIDRLIESGRLAESEGLLYEPDALWTELRVAAALATLAAREFPLSPAQHASVKKATQTLRLEKEQRSAVGMALSHGLSVLSGGPGTGKTTTLKAVIAGAAAIDVPVTLLAPTGKAAARTTQVTGRPAFTIHRWMGAAPDNTLSLPFPGGLLVVEEASMLDLEVAAWLLQTIHTIPDLRVLLVGDSRQLPSVNHGAVLENLLQVDTVPRIDLTIGHRQTAKSTIVRQAHRLRRGETLEHLPEKADWRVVLLPNDAEEAEERVVHEIRTVMREERRSVLRSDVFRPVRDLHVLVPTNGARGEHLGALNLNSTLRELFNPRGKEGPFIYGGVRARVGDRLIALSNDYESGVMNGETGLVTDADAEGRTLTIELHEGRRVTLGGVHTRNLSLAYATTVHKAQGSEFPIVVAVLHEAHGPLVTQRLLYTAITRARERVVLCTTHRAMRVAADRGFLTDTRLTGLSQNLRRELESRGVRARLAARTQQ